MTDVNQIIILVSLWCPQKQTNSITEECKYILMIYLMYYKRSFYCLFNLKWMTIGAGEAEGKPHAELGPDTKQRN